MSECLDKDVKLETFVHIVIYTFPKFAVSERSKCMLYTQKRIDRKAREVELRCGEQQSFSYHLSLLFCLDLVERRQTENVFSQAEWKTSLTVLKMHVCFLVCVSV